MTAILINGQAVPSAQAGLAQDRGLLLGESVFETLLVKNRIPQFWDAHVSRLRAACAFYGLHLADTISAASGDMDATLKQWARALLADNGDDANAILRVTITGGAGGRGLVPQQATEAMCLMSLSPAPSPPTSLKLIISDYAVLAGQPDGDFKTGNYLRNIQARKQAMARGADEALMLNQWGRVASAAAGNVMIETDDGQLLTPPVAEGALPGIMRAQLEHLPDCPVQMAQLSRAMVETARHIYICNSVMEVTAATFDVADDEMGMAIEKARRWRAQLPVETVF